MTLVDLQLLGSPEPPEPPPGGADVVDEPPQPAEASASAAAATRTSRRTNADLWSLKLISVLTIGFRELGKIGSGEEARKALGQRCASLCWTEGGIGNLCTQEN